MTEEEKEGIGYLKKYTEYTKNRAREEYKCECRNIQYAEDLEKRGRIFEIILNLIQKQQAEIEKKDKIIRELEDIFYTYQLCEYEITDYGYRKCEYIADTERPPCKDCIQQYFEKQVEKE